MRWLDPRPGPAAGTTGGGVVTCLVISLLVNSCGGGGRSTRWPLVVLEDLRFPDPAAQSTGGDRAPPDRASLIQTVEYRFSGPVDPAAVDSGSLPIVDTEGIQVPGTFEVRGAVVTFHPSLPLRSPRSLGGGDWDVGGAGLRPATVYQLIVPLVGPRAMPGLRGIAERLWKRYDRERTLADGTRIGRGSNPVEWQHRALFSLRFRTTDDPAEFLTGYPPMPPRVLGSEPRDGADQVSPRLFTDPEHLFPPPGAIRLTLDRALDPSPDNVGSGTVKLIDLEGSTGNSPGIELASSIHLVINRFDRAVVEIRPSGILPFGHHLAIAHAAAIRSISGGTDEIPGDEIDAEFRVAAAPSRTVHDLFREDFVSTRRRERRLAEIGPGAVPAAWDARDSNVLQAAEAYPPGPTLGPFVPDAPPGSSHEIIIDTDRQALPLFDGSTPEAPPGTVVEGGRFTFSEIVIPEQVTLRAIGHHPFVLAATGTVRVGGTIDVSGIQGADDQSYDSAVSPTPGGSGGPGGGRGGDGNPTLWYGTPQLATQVPPRRGQRGWGPGDASQEGGGGGEGAVYPERAWPCGKSHCNQLDGNGPFSRGSGGGGGSFLTEGVRGRDGAGLKVSLEALDASGYPLFDSLPWGQAPSGGLPGRRVFSNGNPLDDFIGALGEVRSPIGGQGGGGGGNRHDSLECTDYVFVNFPGFPGVLADSKGGGGGGGGGVLVIEAVGPIILESGVVLTAAGGAGGRGEQIGCSNWGGGGGGGAGGAILLRSAERVDVPLDPEQAPLLDVQGGIGGYSVAGCGPYSSCGKGRAHHPGSGGDGGQGIVQIQGPPGTIPDVSGIDVVPESSLVPPEWTPSELSAVSVAQSVWIDTGMVWRRGPASPSFSFTGTDPATGRVLVDRNGHVRHPGLNDLAIELPPVIDAETGLILKKGEKDALPPGAWIRVEFQAADAILPGSGDVDPASILPGPGLWTGDIAIAEGHEFLRYRVTFNVADAEQSFHLGPDTRRPIVQWLRLPFRF